MKLDTITTIMERKPINGGYLSLERGKTAYFLRVFNSDNQETESARQFFKSNRQAIAAFNQYNL